MPKSMNTDQKRRAREYLSERDGWTCYYCGAPLIPDGERDKYTTCSCRDGEISYTPVNGMGFPTVDHVQPLSRGGSNDISNLVLCCLDCNQRKGNRV